MGGEQLSAGPLGFVALDTNTVLDYCAAKPEVVAALGGVAGKAKWSAKEVGDGNINFVYIVNGVVAAWLPKQGCPTCASSARRGR